MSWFKNLFKKKVDERQERDLLLVEHYSFWLMFWLLAIEIIIQGIILDDGDKIIGEWIVFMITAVFAVAGFTRKGVWSYQSKKVPGVKSYFLYSVVAGIVGGVLGFLGGMKRSPENQAAILANVVGMATGIFAVSFVGFVIMGTITKHREKKLELEEIDDEEDEEEK